MVRVGGKKKRKCDRDETAIATEMEKGPDAWNPEYGDPITS